MSAGPSTTSRRSAIAAAVSILVFVVAYMATGYLTLDPASRSVPLLAGTVTVGLLLVELLRLGRSATPCASAPRGPEPATTMASERQVLLSIAALIVGFLLVGVLVVLPLYLTGAITLIGRKPLRVALAIAVATTVAIYVAFEWLLSLRLFPGWLLG